MKAIYTREDGGVSVLALAPEALKNSTPGALAAKCIPAGHAFQLVEDDAVPAITENRNDWTVSAESLQSGVGAAPPRPAFLRKKQPVALLARRPSIINTGAKAAPKLEKL